nr:hypothetical protein [uncultured Lachnoclostridium sp.]
MKDRYKIYDYIKTEINPYGRPFGGTVKEFGLKLMDYIENMNDEVSWIPTCDSLPTVELVYESSFNNKYESQKVLIQTKRGEIFSAICLKRVYKNKKYKDDIEWYTYGTGGRRMKVMSKVIAWMPLPELYKEE